MDAAVVSPLPPHLRASPCTSSSALFSSTIAPSTLFASMAVEKTKYPNEFWLGLLPSAQGECSPQFSLAAFCLSNQSW